MNDEYVNQLLEQVAPALAAQNISWTELAEHLLRRAYPAGNKHQADLDRRRRCGFSEVIFGSGKSPEAIVTIAQRLLAVGEQEILVTRVDKIAVPFITSHFAQSRYDALGRTLRLSQTALADNSANAERLNEREPFVAVVCAGSSDLPIAREALETLAWMRISTFALSDIGVAGPYRLLPHLEKLRGAAAVVVIAGMEGALASVLGGLVPCPVVAVPTSVGYGANLQGITTMLSMLSSCAAGVTVVNVDAGFKGGYVAGLIAQRVKDALAAR